MSATPRYIWKTICACLLAIAYWHNPVTQNSSSNYSDASRSGKRSFESRFWNYLVANNYKNWAPPAGQDGDFFDGTGPHGALLKLYLNRTAITNTNSLANESVIVMEDYRSNKTLKSISVMLKSENSNPNGNDWYWVVYRPDGSVIEASERVPTSIDQRYSGKNGGVNSPFKKVSSTNVSSESQTCLQCHRQAPGEDFVFFNQADGHRAATDNQTTSLDDTFNSDSTR